MLFFVYSEKESLTVHVDKDDSFLQEAIPSLEKFYFGSLLPAAAN